MSPRRPAPACGRGTARPPRPAGRAGGPPAPAGPSVPRPRLRRDHLEQGAQGEIDVDAVITPDPVDVVVQPRVEGAVVVRRRPPDRQVVVAAGAAATDRQRVGQGGEGGTGVDAEGSGRPEYGGPAPPAAQPGPGFAPQKAPGPAGGAPNR